MSSGKDVYLAYRHRREIFRGGEISISAAVDKGIASWGIDYETLLEMRNERVLLIGVYVRDEDEIYVTHYDNFFNRDKTVTNNYSDRGGALQQYLPLQYFAKIGNSAVA